MLVDIEILNAFFSGSEITSVSKFGNGHIKKTFLITTKEEKYILQNINTIVFPDAELLIKNHLLVDKIISSTNDKSYQIPKLLKTNAGNNFYKDKKGNYWRAFNFLNNTYSIEKTETTQQAEEAGRAYGWFISALDNNTGEKPEMPLKDFHNLFFRIQEFNEALANDVAGRSQEISKEITFYLLRTEFMLEIDSLIKSIPKRIVHNDTKINNLLFSDGKVEAIIDLDTVGEGSLLHDFGDSLRTIANSADEDETNLDKVEFNLDYFSAYTEGFLKHTSTLLNGAEKQFLSSAPAFMTYIIGLRFLTDYLNGDVYFGVSKPQHNLIRARVQQKLIQDIESKDQEINSIVNKLLS